MAVPALVGTPVVSVYSNPLSVTPGAGSDVLGIAGQRLENSVGPGSATLDAVGMTRQQTASTTESGFELTTSIHSIASPGTSAVDLLMAGTGSSTKGFASYENVSAIGALGNAESTAGSTSPGLSLAASANDKVLFIISWDGGSGNSLTNGSGATTVWNTQEDGKNLRCIEMDGATTTTFAGTLSSSAKWSVVGMVLEGTGGGSITLDEDYQLIIPVQASW